MLKTYTKNIISYLTPIPIETREGEQKQWLEIRLSMGKFILDSSTVNYSFGSLHQIFKSIFSELKIKEKPLENILILGLGGGSVVSLLRKNYAIAAPITALENDCVVIQLAEKYFGINDYKNLTIVNQDAMQYVLKEKSTYDLIIVDLFIDNKIPKIFDSPEFISALRKLSRQKSCLIFNRITSTINEIKACNVVAQNIGRDFHEVRDFQIKVNGTSNTLLYVNTL